MSKTTTAHLSYWNTKASYKWHKDDGYLIANTTGRMFIYLNTWNF